MIRPPDPDLMMAVPVAVLASAGLAVLIWLTAHLVRYAATARSLRPVLRRAWLIKYTWKRTACRVGLVQTERSRPPWWSSRPATTVVTRELVPPVTSPTLGALVKSVWTSRDPVWSGCGRC
jgi:hypothetical protein